MNKAPFSTFITQLKEQKLSRDKFYFLKQAASAFYFFNGDQLCQIALCFPHSTDKKEAVAFLETRLASDISCETAARVIKSASFSRDRLGILQILVGHLQRVTEDDEQKVVIGAFDFFIDKDQAWSILAKQCEVFGGSCPALPASDEEIIEHIPAPQVHQMVRDAAKEQTQAAMENLTRMTFPEVEPRPRLSIFDLPIMSNLSILRQEMPAMEEKIYEEVQRRRDTGQNFVIPSRIWAITTNLKPGRRLTLPEPESPSDIFPVLPDIVLDTERRSPVQEIVELRDRSASPATSEVSTTLTISRAENEAVEGTAADRSIVKCKRILRKRIREPVCKEDIHIEKTIPGKSEITDESLVDHHPIVQQKPPPADSSHTHTAEVVTFRKQNTISPRVPVEDDRRKTIEVLSATSQNQKKAVEAIPPSCSSPIPLSMYYRQEQFSPVTKSLGPSPVPMSPVRRYYTTNPPEIRRNPYTGSTTMLNKSAEKPYSPRIWRPIPESRAFSTTSLNKVGIGSGRSSYGIPENISMTGSRVRYRARFSKPDYRPRPFEYGDDRYQRRSLITPSYHYSAYRSPSSRLYYIR